MVEPDAGAPADDPSADDIAVVDDTAAVVEELALALEGTGLPRMAGRVVGVLLVAGGPQSLDSLASSLGASKASMSTTARQLARLGLLDQVALPGERRDHYRLRHQGWAVLLQDRADALARLGAVARRSGSGSGAGAGPPDAGVTGDLGDLAELVRFCDLAGDELATFIEGYQS